MSVVDCEEAVKHTYTLTVDGRELMQLDNAIHLLNMILARDEDAPTCETCIQSAHELEEKIDRLTERLPE